MTVGSQKELKILREGGRKLAAVLERVKKELKPGVKTEELDRLAEKFIRESGGEPSFMGYRPSGAKIPYPGTLCVSVNDEIVHALPGERLIKEGDVVGLDIGMEYGGLFTDMAETVGVGKIKKEDERLIGITREALLLALSVARPGAKTGDIGEAVQKFSESEGFGVVRELVGHGVGKRVHEKPDIPNWGKAGEGTELKEGMVIAIEPMVTAGSPEIYLAPDGWVWKTKDGRNSAHFEHTLVLTREGAEVLTKL